MLGFESGRGMLSLHKHLGGDTETLKVAGAREMG